MGAPRRIRNTSKQVYHQIKASGVLSQRRWEVFDWLWHNGPATGREAIRGARAADHGPVISQTRARLTELRDMGAIEEIGTTIDNVTGNEVILWDVTGNMPHKLPPRVKGKTRKQLEEENRQLRAENDRLKQALQTVYGSRKNPPPKKPKQLTFTR